jgi:hypothetical protein
VYYIYENAVMPSRDGTGPSPYRPDVSPSDLHVFSYLKIALKSHRFGSDEDVETMVVQRFQQLTRELFAQGIFRWRNNGIAASIEMGSTLNGLKLLRPKQSLNRFNLNKLRI